VPARRDAERWLIAQQPRSLSLASDAQLARARQPRPEVPTTEGPQRGRDWPVMARAERRHGNAGDSLPGASTARLRILQACVGQFVGGYVSAYHDPGSKRCARFLQ